MKAEIVYQHHEPSVSFVPLVKNGNCCFGGILQPKCLIQKWFGGFWVIWNPILITTKGSKWVFREGKKCKGLGVKMNQSVWSKNGLQKAPPKWFLDQLLGWKNELVWFFTKNRGNWAFLSDWMWERNGQKRELGQDIDLKNRSKNYMRL